MNKTNTEVIISLILGAQQMGFVVLSISLQCSASLLVTIIKHTYLSTT